MSYIRVRETKRRVKGKPIRRYQAIWTENGKEFRETSIPAISLKTSSKT